MPASSCLLQSNRFPQNVGPSHTSVSSLHTPALDGPSGGGGIEREGNSSSSPSLYGVGFPLLMTSLFSNPSHPSPEYSWDRVCSLNGHEVGVPQELQGVTVL